MADLPRREQSPEEIKANEALIAQGRDRENQKKRIQDNKKIRCPCCKKNKYFDQYLSNKSVGCLLCPNCGVLFIDQDKLKIVKKNISDAKQHGLVKTVGAGVRPKGVVPGRPSTIPSGPVNPLSHLLK